MEEGISVVLCACACGVANRWPSEGASVCLAVPLAQLRAWWQLMTTRELGAVIGKGGARTREISSKSGARLGASHNQQQRQRQQHYTADAEKPQPDNEETTPTCKR